MLRNARSLNARQTVDGKRKGGASAGRAAVASGRLALAGRKGAERIAEVARLNRERPGA